jgi:hypothetical protein
LCQWPSALAIMLSIVAISLTDRYLGPIEQAEAHYSVDGNNCLPSLPNPQRSCVRLVLFSTKGNEMRFFLAILIALAVVYFCDAEYNQGKLFDGLQSMGQSMFHSMGH